VKAKWEDPRLQEGWAISTIMLLLGLAAFLAYRVLGEEHRRAVGRAVRPAFILGAVGLCFGFFGPMILSPEANQGSLLGVYITGPTGFAVGLLLGVVREVLRRHATI
jgi:hypothetical protein